MIGGTRVVLILLVVVAVAVIAVVASRGRGHVRSPRPHPAKPETFDLLDQAVTAGLIDASTAGAIRALGTETPAPTPESAPKPTRPVPAVAEALGYVGAVLVMVGLTVPVGQTWEDLPVWGRLLIPGAVAGLFFVVGALLRDESEPVLWRLRNFVWLLSAGALAGFVGEATADALSWPGKAVAVSIGTVTAVYGAALWRLGDRPLPHLTTLAGLLVAVGGVAAWLDGPGAIGLAVLAVGGIWLALGLRQILPPEPLAIALGAVTAVIGPAITTASWEKAAPLIGLAVAVSLIVAGTVLHQFTLTGIGVVSIFAYLPWTISALFGDAVGAPVIMLVSGVLLLVVMLVMLLRPHDHSGGAHTRLAH